MKHFPNLPTQFHRHVELVVEHILRSVYDDLEFCETQEDVVSSVFDCDPFDATGQWVSLYLGPDSDWSFILAISNEIRTELDSCIWRLADQMALEILEQVASVLSFLEIDVAGLRKTVPDLERPSHLAVMSGFVFAEVCNPVAEGQKVLLRIEHEFFRWFLEVGTAAEI